MLERVPQNFKIKSYVAQSWVFFKLHIHFPHLLRALLPYLLGPYTTQSIWIGSIEETSSEDKGWKLELQEHFASSLSQKLISFGACWWAGVTPKQTCDYKTPRTSQSQVVPVLIYWHVTIDVFQHNLNFFQWADSRILHLKRSGLLLGLPFLDLHTNLAFSLRANQTDTTPKTK